FHLADHGLPDRDRIVALVGHRRPPAILAKALSPRHFRPYHTVVTGGSTARPSSEVAGRRRLAGIESLLRRGKPWHRVPPITSGDATREFTRPSAAADRPRQRHRPLLRDLRRRRSRTDAADHGARRPDDPLGRRFLPAVGRPRFSR